MTPLERIEAMIELLDSPFKYLRRSYAGYRLPTLRVSYRTVDAPTANCFCLIGAECRVTRLQPMDVESDREGSAWVKIVDQLIYEGGSKLIKNAGTVTRWNDGHSWQSAVDLLKRTRDRLITEQS